MTDSPQNVNVEKMRVDITMTPELEAAAKEHLRRDEESKSLQRKIDHQIWRRDMEAREQERLATHALYKQHVIVTNALNIVSTICTVAALAYIVTRLG